MGEQVHAACCQTLHSGPFLRREGATGPVQGDDEIRCQLAACSHEGIVIHCVLQFMEEVRI
jgi:hypothetical protein